jgi:hypothetical protein
MDSVVRLRYNYRQSESHRNSFRSSGLRRVCAMAALTASLYLTTDTLMPIEQPSHRAMPRRGHPTPTSPDWRGSPRS